MLPTAESLAHPRVGLSFPELGPKAPAGVENVHGAFTVNWIRTSLSVRSASGLASSRITRTS